MLDFLARVVDSTYTRITQIVPLLSQSSHPLPASVNTEQLEALTNRIQFGGDEVVKAKDGTGSATLSMAYAGAEFATRVIRALAGEKGLVAPSYVHLDADREGGATVRKEIGRDLDYFSTNVEIGVSRLRRHRHCTAAHRCHIRDSPMALRGSFLWEI